MSNAKFLFIIYLINGMEWASLNLDRNVFSFILNKIPLKHRWLCQSCEIWRKCSNYEVTHVDEIHTKHYLCVIHDIHSECQIQSSWFLSLCCLNCKLGVKDLNSDSSSYILPVCPQTNLQGGNRNLKNSAILQGDCFLVSIMPKTRLTCDG